MNRPGTKRKYTKGVVPPRVKEIRKIAKEETKRELAKTTELKILGTAFTPAMDFNGVVTAISNVPVANREGDFVNPTSLDFRYSIDGEVLSGIVRIVVFRYNDVTTPAASAVLVGGLLGSPFGVISPHTHQNKKLVQVIYDKTHTVSNNGGSELLHIEKTLKLANRQIQFEIGMTTGYDKYWILCISDRSLATSPGVNVYSRLYFTDS